MMHTHDTRSVPPARSDLERKRHDETVQEASAVILDAQHRVQDALAATFRDLVIPDRDINITRRAAELTDYLTHLVIACIKNPDAL